MKKVGFIGAYDKCNLIMCVAKVLTMKNKRVLIIDTTAEQKFKYIVPTIHPTRTYITTWEQIDVAVGFEDVLEILEYIGATKLEQEYDIVLMNIDNPKAFDKMQVETNDINCFVTAMDLYSIRKGIEIFSGLQKPMKLVKIIFSKIMEDADNEYIDYLALGSRMEWSEKQIFFPLILDDKYVEMDNQLIYRLGLRTMSVLYKESLATLIGMLFKEEIKEQEAKRIIKALEKDGV